MPQTLALTSRVESALLRWASARAAALLIIDGLCIDSTDCGASWRKLNSVRCYLNKTAHIELADALGAFDLRRKEDGQ